MAIIQHRTVFYEKKDGPVRFSDFARVITPIGVCAEPFMTNNRLTNGEFEDFDPADEMARIDEMKGIDMNKETLLFSGDEILHGGVSMPRVGR